MFGLKSKVDLSQQAYEAEFEGNIKKAISLWSKVVAQNPKNLDAVISLTNLLYESQQLKEAINIIQPLADRFHENIKIQKLFFDILISANEFEWAKRHADILDNKNPDNNFRKYINAAEINDANTIAVEAETVQDDDWLSSFAGEALFTKDHAARLNMLFTGRQDVFARMWVSDSGNTGYSPVYKPYTPQIAYNHLLGNYTTGIYLTKSDGDTRILAFDIDITSDAINSARGSSEKATELRKTVFDYAGKFFNFLKNENLNPVLEDSGYKGAHIWIVFNKWAKCGLLRRLGEALLVANGNVPSDISVEIFPKQKFRPKKLGNLIKLPLGIHRKTGKRSVLLDSNAKPFDNQPEALMDIKPADISLVPNLLDKYNLPEDINFSAKKQPPNAHAKLIKNAQQQNRRKIIISEDTFNSDGPLNHLLKNCDVLNKLVSRVKTSHMISYEEKLTLEHIIGHLPNGAELVNFLLRPCENVDSNFLMGKSLKGYPTSCTKIVNHVPHIAVTCSCNCDFGIACANYPTPLNHLYSYVPETIKALPAPQQQEIQKENRAIDIVKLLSKLYGK